jgi:hypothetical protein
MTNYAPPWRPRSPLIADTCSSVWTLHKGDHAAVIEVTVDG